MNEKEKQRPYTNMDLLRFHNEIEDMKKGVMYRLIKSRIGDFYKWNGQRLNALIDKITKLQKKYFVYLDDKIQYEDVPLTESELETPQEEVSTRKPQRRPVMIEGGSMEEYSKEFSELMSQEAQLRF